MPPQTEDSRVGSVLLGKLQVIRRIGGGGMGEVYEVEHLLTRHRRALKIVRAEIAQERRFMERFLREASIAGRLGTPFVTETFDAGWLEDESAYLLMELLSGRSLHDLLEDDGMLSLRRAAALMCQVAEGVQVAHEASIVHRDLKPENIFVTSEDGRERVKILDFGVSKFLDVTDEKATKLTREGSSVGTPYYMAPEQAAGKEVDARADVWAMGVILYELLTGRPPFDGETVGEVFLKIGGGNYVPLEHRRPDVDPAIFPVVERALEPDLSKRTQSAEALRRELLPFAGGEPAARAKTISDGGPVGEVTSSPRIPKPAAVPVVADASAREPTGRTPRSNPPAVRVLDLGPTGAGGTSAAAQSSVAAPNVPPPATAATGTRRLFAAAALVLVAVAVSFAALWRDGSSAASTETPPVPAALPPVVIADPPPHVDEPTPVATPEAVEVTTPSIAEEPPPTRTTTPRTPRRTRAEVAGLEDDPYDP